MQIEGNVVDLFSKSIYPATIWVENGKIQRIEKNNQLYNHFILPGFVDAHIHIESSMLTPAEFAKIAVQHGTIATVSDPHEIANVLGIEGVEYMIESGNTVPLKFNFGAPSCVPATKFETSGAELTTEDVSKLLQKNEIKYLSEMMNWPGVLHRDPDVMAKIKAAHDLNKPVDGHAPGLMGEQAEQYVSAGISTDHECFSEAEALGKLKLGMKVLIREGSAAKNYRALNALIPEHYENLMFCSDDKHPDDLLLGHINKLVARAVNEDQHPLFAVLQMACINPVHHYKLDVGLLREGDSADFIVVNNLTDFDVLKTVINGSVVFENKEITFKTEAPNIVNQFAINSILPEDFAIKVEGKSVNCIVALDGELITQSEKVVPSEKNGFWEANVEQDLLKIAVINRYQKAPVACSFVKNFGLKEGAIASSVAHDSHNIVVVGADDNSMAKAAQLVIESKGGLSIFSNHSGEVLPLPIAGIISNLPFKQVAEKYADLLKRSHAQGCTLTSPFMTMSFLALLVIPQLKLSDKGLFDGEKFEFAPQQFT